jgi:hypothetical protein
MDTTHDFNPAASHAARPTQSLRPSKIRESHFADDNTMLIFSLGSAAGIPATSPAKDLRARAAKNAKDGALGRALEICRNADPRVYLMECKPGAPKIVVSEETQRHAENTQRSQKTRRRKLRRRRRGNHV